MTGCPVLAVGFVLKIAGFLFILSCAVLILVVMIQKGKGGGLSSAFGGSGASGILGSKTGDFLTWVTIGVVGVLLVLALVMDRWYKPVVRSDYDVPASSVPADVNEGVNINQEAPVSDMNQASGSEAPLN